MASGISERALPPERPLVRAAGLVAVPVQPLVLEAVAPFRLQIELFERLETLITSIETTCPGLLLIDTDLASNFEDLQAFARSLRPDVRIVALSCYWSDREESLRAWADAVLHKPPRPSEWASVLGEYADFV
jgi:hypothetical protein